MSEITSHKPRSQRGPLTDPRERYGFSVLGAPLLYFPAAQPDNRSGVILAGTHGDETASMVALSCAMRSLPFTQRRHHVVLSVNPDGCQLGLRANANGVDLNRNFPTHNWRPSPTVYRWNTLAAERDVALSPGMAPGSEPETRALCDLITQLQPAWIVSLHEPLACVDDPSQSSLGRWLADAFTLPVVKDVGYATPGSFGSWCAEQQLPCITLELPVISADEASERYLSPLMALLGHEFLFHCN